MYENIKELLLFIYDDIVVMFKTRELFFFKIHIEILTDGMI